MPARCWRSSTSPPFIEKIPLSRRLLSQSPDAAVARATAETFAAAITKMKSAQAVDEAARYAAEDDRLTLRNRIAAAYPFHPALMDIMTERWASLPDFQRTRGALRFLSVCLHTLKRENRARQLLGPGDIPIKDDDVAHAFFTEVGQRESQVRHSARLHRPQRPRRAH